MKGILFSDRMAQAIYDGRKTVTRQLRSYKNGMSHQPVFYGETVYVKECFRYAEDDLALPPDAPVPVDYRADPMKESIGCDGFDWLPWRSSMFMPEWAARTKLRILDVGAEQLQEITEEDARKEGIGGEHCHAGIDGGCGACESCDPLFWFEKLWNAINKKHPWDSNPWVSRIAFERVKA